MNIGLDALRVFLHVLSASVWVGGQIVLGALVPTLRGISDDAPKVVAQRFNQVAWPFFALAVLTGLWNLVEVNVGDRGTSYHMALGVKLVVVALSGVSAFLHTQATKPSAKGMWGAIGGITALLALFFGAVLAT